MKYLISTLFLLCLVVSQAQIVNNSSTNPAPLCHDDPFTPNYFYFNNNVIPYAHLIDPGNDYGCLTPTLNDSSQTLSPFWYYFKVDAPGQIDLFINIYTTASSSHLIYGPFNDYTSMIGSSGTLGGVNSPIAYCAIDQGPNDDTVSLNPTQSGQYYLLLITDFNSINTTSFPIDQVNLLSTSTGSLDTTLCGYTHHLSGHVFYDENTNGVRDGNEYNISPDSISITPNPTYSIGGASSATALTNNFYATNISTSPQTYTIDHTVAPQFSYSTPNQYNINLDSVNNTNDTLNFGVYPNSIAPDITLDMTSPVCEMHCIHGGILFFNVENTGTQLFTDVQIRIELDTLATYDAFNFQSNMILNSYPVLDSVVDHNVYFSCDSLDLFQDFNLACWVDLDTTVLSNDSLYFSVHVTATDNLNTTLNVSDTVLKVVSCSYDPNNKLTFPNGQAGPDEILPTDQLEYVINFQNTGTAEAVNIKITDTISPHLDLSTFRLINNSHLMHYVINQNNRIITFYFNNINLPDSMTSPIGSMGYVKYSIDPLPTLVPHTEIYNGAHIYFDYNAPIATNLAYNIIDCIPFNATLNGGGGTNLWIVDNPNHSFQWYLNDTLIPGANADELQITSNGLYTVVVTDQYNCEASSSFNVDYMNIISLDQDEVSIYPIPSRDNLYIQYNAANISNVKLYNLQGKLVYQQANIGAHQCTINLNDLPKGVYMLKVIDENELEVTKKIIKV